MGLYIGCLSKLGMVHACLTEGNSRKAQMDEQTFLTIEILVNASGATRKLKETTISFSFGYSMSSSPSIQTRIEYLMQIYSNKLMMLIGRMCRVYAVRTR